MPVLIPIAKPPPKLTPGSVTASVPEIDAATPPEVICSAPVPLVIDSTPPPSDRLTLLAATTTVPVVSEKAKSPLRVWPRTPSWPPVMANDAAPFVTSSWTPGLVLPGIVSVSLKSLPVLLNRTVTVPVTVIPFTPTSVAVPDATSAYVFVDPLGSSTRPICAFDSSTPVASGLIDPSGNIAGPWPRKTCRPLPANDNAPVPSVGSEPKLTFPEIDTKLSMLSDAFESEMLKTGCAEAPNLISIDWPPTVTV